MTGAIPRGRPVFVYGAGNMGRRLTGILRAGGHDVRGYLDQRGGGAAGAADAPVYRPGEDPLGSADRADAVVVVGVFNHNADPVAIAGALRAPGYGRVLSFYDAHALYADALGDQYWLTARPVYQEQADDVARAAGLWADARSRDLYERLLHFRASRRLEDLPAPDPGPQYWDASLGALPEPVHFVDCGAFDGDSLRDGVAAGVRFGSVCAFEPDEANFRALADYAAGDGAPADVRLWPCGVADATGQLRFAAGGGAASAVAGDGDVVVQCVALDDALPAAAPTYVKMDIEGAEPAALRGARRLLARARPRLAVCVYHQPDHLWSVPLWVDALGLDYALHLRVHRYNGFDVVLYAVPR